MGKVLKKPSANKSTKKPAVKLPPSPLPESEASGLCTPDKKPAPQTPKAPLKEKPDDLGYSQQSPESDATTLQMEGVSEEALLNAPEPFLGIWDSLSEDQKDHLRNLNSDPLAE